MPIGAGVAALISGIAGAGASVAGAGIASHNANKAATANLAAQNHAVDVQDAASRRAEAAAQEQQTYDRWLTSATSAARQPFLNEAASLAGGINSNYNPTPYAAPAGFQAPTMEAALNDPGFQATAAQAQKGLEHSAAARGTLLTGGTGQDIANQQGALAANRYSDVYNRAQSLYAMNEGLRKQAYDVNNQNDFNAASLRQSASLSRINELLSLAGLASPGQYPGSTPTTGQGINERVWQPGMPQAGSDPNVDTGKGYINGATDQTAMPYGPTGSSFSSLNNPNPGAPLTRAYA